LPPPAGVAVWVLWGHSVHSLPWVGGEVQAYRRSGLKAVP
jgi:hypothetical protein